MQSVTIAAVLSGLLGALQGQPVADRPLSEQAYAGLVLGDTDKGTIVEFPMFGPFHGDTRRSDSVWRGDVVVSVACGGLTLRADREGDEQLSAAAFRTMVQAAHPGDELTIVYRRAADAEKHMDDNEPYSDPPGQERTASVRLGSKDEWTGSVGRGLRAGAAVEALPEGEFEGRVLGLLDQLGLGPLQDGGPALFKYLTDAQNGALDPNSLPAVIEAYRRPLSAPTVEASLAGRVRAMLDSPDLVTAIVGEAAVVLDVQPGGTARPIGAPDRQIAMRLVGSLRAWPFITDYETIGLTRRSKEIFDGCPACSAALPVIAARIRAWGSAAPAPATPVPDEIRGAVTGDIAGIEKTEHGWLVRGGPGPNQYDMSRLASVIDDGGDDLYRWPGPAPSEVQVIIDRSGNDRYESNTDFAGPGAGVFGLSLVDDEAGNDVYSTTSQCSLASGLFGLGIVIDRAGDDQYSNSGPGAGWVEGAGFYGAGVLVDLDGRDQYRGEVLCQGVGGPRGFGAIVDVRGDDTYASVSPNFKTTSALENSWHSMSQGVGYGVRWHASGGVGAIYDLAGDDQYDAGEYAQGCGYFYGMGILHDAAGRDRYTGAAFVQAYAAHQGVGMLVDDEGDDAYTARLLTGQSTAWDQSMAWLIDRRGDDVYASLEEGQGAATYQSLAVLLDLDGSDTYGSGPGMQGQPGFNGERPGLPSMFGLAALLDLGGKPDRYSVPGRADGQTATVGGRDEGSPDKTRLYGIFADQ